MSEKKNNTAIAGGLLLTVILWGGNNAGTKWLVTTWPPIWTGATRFLLAGIFLFAVLRFTKWLGTYQPLTRELRRSLWLRGGLSLAAYIVAFCWARHLHRRVARRALSRRVAHLGVAVGGTSAPGLGERAALRCGPACGRGRVGFILAGVENGGHESGR